MPPKISQYYIVSYLLSHLSCYYCILHVGMGILIKYADGSTTNNAERISICAFDYMFLFPLSFAGSCYFSYYWYVVPWFTVLHMKNGPQVKITENNLLPISAISRFGFSYWLFSGLFALLNLYANFKVMKNIL